MIRSSYFFRNTLKILCLINFNLIYSIVAEFPSDIPKCNSGDVECIRKVANDVIEKNPHGHKGLLIPDLEPFHINFVQAARQENRPVSVNITMKNLDYHGFSTLRFTKFVGFEKDPETSKFELYLESPKLNITGQYGITGRLLVFPIQGDGDIQMVMTNVRISIKLKPKVFIKNGKRYLEAEKLKILMQIDKLQTKMTNLFNGDQSLGESMNRIMNENWKIIWDEIEPSVNVSVTQVVKNLLNRMFDKISYDEIFSD